MLIDKLEEVAQEIMSMRKEWLNLNREYRKSFEKDIRDEINFIEKKIKAARSRLLDFCYLNLMELKLLYKHFPELFQMYAEDLSIGPVIKRIQWLLDFRPEDEATVLQKLNSIQKELRALDDAVDFANEMHGWIDEKSVIATWPSLKGKVHGSMTKEELLAIIEEKRRELNKKAWLLSLNQPFIDRQVARFFKRLRMAIRQEADATTVYKHAISHGSKAEDEAKNKLDEIQIRRKKIERQFTHLVLANPAFFYELKKGKSLGKSVEEKMLMKYFENVPLNLINEEEWKKKMNKRLS